MSKEKDWNLELSEYIKQGEPSQVEKTLNWETAIGLQDVDGLKPSKYLIKTAKEHIEGTIDIEEVKIRIDEYYEVQDNRKKFEERNEEADKVAVRIAELLSENAFNFAPTELLNIHKRLFEDIYHGAGVYRDYNFTKKEWVLNGDTVIYAPFDTIKETLEYDFEQEKYFSYKDLSLDDSIKHLSKFISNIWQIHPFCEGNTRTIAVFLIKYLRTFGFKLNDEIFADNSWYFRNSLVRANYKNFDKNVFEDTSFLEKFFYNLLTNVNNELKNRYTHIDYINEEEEGNAKVNNYTLEEQAIINILKTDSTVTQEEIALQINKSVRTVKTYMAEMQEKGLIERINSKKNGEWIVIGNVDK
ncbi:MAG: Fic family protein [Clostridia bacterium]|nr:Fic family protein [Clostridia bacterium]